MRLSRLVKASDAFVRKYGRDWEIVFVFSAKKAISEVEIRGPSRLRRSNTVEFTVLLPVDTIMRSPGVVSAAMTCFLQAVCVCLTKVNLDTEVLTEKISEIAERVASDPKMLGFPGGNRRN